MRRITIVTALAILACSAGVFVTTGRARSKTPPGLEPYVPTRIEWLVLELSVANRHELASLDDYELDFVGKDAGTAVVVVQYTKNVNREAMNKAVERAKKDAEHRIRVHGWDDWAKIEENVHMLD